MKSKAKVKAPGLAAGSTQAMHREQLSRAIQKSTRNIFYFTDCLVAACARLAAQSAEWKRTNSEGAKRRRRVNAR